MHIVAGHQRGPFITDERRKLPGIVVLLRGLDIPLPDRLELRSVRPVHQGIRKIAIGEQADHLISHSRPVTRLDPVIPVSARWIRQNAGLASKEIREKAHIVGMV